MKKTIATKWVAALRSGDYVQGTGMLRTPDNKFCCLGVLCNLHAIAHPAIAAEQPSPIHYLGNSTVLAYGVQKWAGLMSFVGATRGDAPPIHNGRSELDEANDHGASFAKIADYIEKNYQAL